MAYQRTRCWRAGHVSYCEVWPPNVGWRHLEGLLDRSSGRTGHLRHENEGGDRMRGSIACYPPVWGWTVRMEPLKMTTRRCRCVRTAHRSHRHSLGASALIFGDRRAALCDPYTRNMRDSRSTRAPPFCGWRRFALRCRDLFIDGEDTSWYEINDENAPSLLKPALLCDLSQRRVTLRPGRARAGVRHRGSH